MSNAKKVHVLDPNFGEMPQGGDILADGRHLTVDVMTGEIRARAEDGSCEILGRVTPGPMAVLRGSDGAFYLAHTGGVIGDFWFAETRIAPCIQRLRPGAETPDILLTEVAGQPLVSPHDLAFGPDGRLYVADSNIWQWEPEKRTGTGRIIAINPDGSAELLVDTGNSFPCGLVVEADGSVVWTESYTDKLRRRRPDGRVEEIIQLPGGATPHGVRVGQDGSLWVACYGTQSIDEVDADGSRHASYPLPGNPMHLAFAGDALMIASFRPIDAENMAGQVLKLETGMAGAPTARGAIAV